MVEFPADSERASFVVELTSSPAPAEIARTLTASASKHERLEYLRARLASLKQPLLSQLAQIPDVEVRDLEAMPAVVVNATGSTWRSLLAEGGPLDLLEVRVAPNTAYTFR